MKETHYAYMTSPVGRIRFVGDGHALSRLALESEGHPRPLPPTIREDTSSFAAAREQLTAYFAGELREFELQLDPEGTEFQQAVWRQLRAIPFGSTMSYGELARRVGNPAASRAVGAANGRNPIAIVVPCHRVIGSDGSLTGYGGGLPRKTWLLQHEANVQKAQARLFG